MQTKQQNSIIIVTLQIAESIEILVQFNLIKDPNHFQLFKITILSNNKENRFSILSKTLYHLITQIILKTEKYNQILKILIIR